MPVPFLRRIIDVQAPSGFRNRFFNLRGGQLTKLPELPCNFDDPELTFFEFLLCTTGALDRLVADGVISKRRASRLLLQSILAWASAH